MDKTKLKHYLNRSKSEALHFLIYLKQFYAPRWIVFLNSVLLIFLFTTLRTLLMDGSEIFELQKEALSLSVFSRTDLKLPYCKLLEEELRAMDGVKSVDVSSPEESLAAMAADGALSAESQYLQQKSVELKGKNSILPWSFSLHLWRWDESFLKELADRIKNLEVGFPKTRVVAEVRYDRERWVLAYALYNYVRWLSAVQYALAAFLLAYIAAFSVKLIKAVKSGIFSAAHRAGHQGKGPQFFLTEGSALLVFGLSVGLLSHFLYLFILSVSFFSDTFTWENHFGNSIFPQLILGILLSLLGYNFHSSRMTAHEGHDGQKERAGGEPV